MSLPAGVSPDQIGVRLDGKPAAAAVEEGVLTIPLADGGGQGRHLLELGYQFADRPAHGAMSLELPRLGRRPGCRRSLLATHPAAERAPVDVAEWFCRRTRLELA